jgi:AbrB family looped-hinge helix DNA binding protein
MYTIKITAQGQISIPAKVRKKLGAERTHLNLIEEEGRFILEPVPDILSLKGSLKNKAKKNLPIDKIIAEEEKAWENAVVERYRKSLGK